MSLVHRDCLDRWRKTVPLIHHNNQRDTRCEICLYEFEFEGKIAETKYSTWRIIWDMLKILVTLQIIGFLLGMFMTGFGEVTTMIAIKYMNLYLYQYLLGNTVIHLVLGILIIIEVSTRSGGEDCGPCFCCIYLDGGNVDGGSGGGGDDRCCALLLFIMFFFSLLIVVSAVYYLSVEKSRQRQRLQNDHRRVKDLGGYGVPYTIV